MLDLGHGGGVISNFLPIIGHINWKWNSCYSRVTYKLVENLEESFYDS